jgi:pyruvate carboxylase
MMFGDIVKVTPSSKVVGDMSMFLVKNNLEPEDVFTTKEDLAFPESVVGMFKGMLGQPYQGWPQELQKIILKGEQPITCRPGELLEPADFEEERLKLEEKLGHRCDDRAVVSAILYPSVYPEFDRHRQQYSDISVIPTPIFFYGLEPGQETSLDIEPGKTLIIKLNTVGKVQGDGTRAVYFELNGNNRSVVIRDRSVKSDKADRVKAEKSNPCHIGAPMPGKVLKINVKAGDAFKTGDVLMVTEAMKMETNIKAKTDGAVTAVKFKEGEAVEKEDLVIVVTE